MIAAGGGAYRKARPSAWRAPAHAEVWTPPAVSVVDMLAAYRLTVLITRDSITRTQRDALVVWLQDAGHPKLAELPGCPWCAGVWISAGVVLARRLAPRWWSPVAHLLAAAAVAGLGTAASDALAAATAALKRSGS